MKRPILIIALAVAVAMHGFAQAPQTPKKRTSQTGTTVRKHRVADVEPVAPELTAAEAAIDKRDFATAEQHLRIYLEKKPNDYRAQFDLGFVLNATGRRDEAIDAYKKSVAADPTMFEPMLNLGLLLAEAGNLAESEKYLRSATLLKPTAHPQEGLERAWISLGHVLERKPDPKGALAAFETAARLRPNDPEPHISAAVLHEQAQQWDNAEKEYQASLQLDPKNPEALAGLVNVYMKADKLDQAEASLRKFLELNPQNANAHIQLGRVLMALHRSKEGAEELATGAKLSPADPKVLRDLASANMLSKNYADAEAQYRQALQLAPNDARLHHDLGTALMQQRKFTDAQAEILKAIQLDPKLGEAYGELAIVASENQNYVLTIKALEARAQYLPESPGTLFLRATAYDHLHAVKEAAEYYHKFLDVAGGRFPDQEWQARHRLIAIEPKK